MLSNRAVERTQVNIERSLDVDHPPRSNFVDVLRYRATNTPAKYAYRFTDGENNLQDLTYAQLLARVEGLAGYLQDLGAQGERILLFYPPGLDFVVGFYACHAAGAIAVPAYPPRKNRRATRIRSIAQDAQARFGLSLASIIDQVQSNGANDFREMTLVASDDPATQRADLYRYLEIDPEDVAVLQYTSGSTGSPKGVVLSHGNLMRNCELIVEAFEIKPDHRGLVWLPTYHDMGLVGGILNPLFVGETNILMSPMTFLQKPARWLQAISKYQVVVSGGPNFAYQLCVDKVTDEELRGLDLSSWKTAFNGAEPIRESTIRAFSDRFGKYGFDPSAFLPCYGMAETTLIVTGGPSEGRPVLVSFDKNGLDQGSVRPSTEGDQESRILVGCGAVLADETVVIVDPETKQRCAADEIGEIWVQSPCVGKGYYRNTAATAETFIASTAQGQGPFLRTGDLGFLYQGQLFVTGRIKDMIIVRGVNRYPQDIEQTVERASSAVQTGAVAAVAVQRDGREHLMIVAETVRHRDLHWDAEIAAIRRAVTAEHELPPDGIFLVRSSSVPKTSSGKIQRHACHEAILANELKIVACWTRGETLSIHSPEGATVPMPVMQAAGGGSSPGKLARGSQPRKEIVDLVKAHVRGVAKERAGVLTGSTDIVLDLGLDSLERLEIAHNLEQAFGGRFPEETLQEMETIDQVALAIEENMGVAAINRAIRLRATMDAGRPSESLEIVRAEDEVSLRNRVIPEEDFRFELLPEYLRLKQTMAQVQLTGIPNPYFSVHEGTVRDTTKINGRTLLSFSSYNYLGLSGHPAVNRAAQEAIQQYGTSVSASRLVSGEKPIHGELEREIADFLGVQSAVTFVGGHSTNETVIGHLVGPGDFIVHDSLSHNSIVQGAILSGARRRAFPHNDFHELNRLLEEVRGQYRRVLIIVEGTYSMDGDYPELTEFVRVKERHKCFLMVDEAHSLGTLGETGRGIGEFFGIDPHRVDIWMGTLSKALASCGGYIAGSHALVELLKYTAPGFVFSVGMPPAAAGAALASLRLLRSEPERVARLRQRSSQFLRRAKSLGFDTGASGGTPVIPIITGNSLLALRLSHRLFLEGVNVQPILYPAVEEAAARLRFFITSEHTSEQIEQTISLLAKHGTELGIIVPGTFLHRIPQASLGRNALGA